jgi:[CysO sulfur-carrier protein]-S-L-cysteine hydrolase
MIAHAQAELPNECCGLLAGTIGADGIARIEHRFAMVNALASPTEYEWEPKSHFAAVREMRRLAMDMLAIYHSHPTTHPVPSRKDCARYNEVRPLIGDLMHFIVGLHEGTPTVRGWWLARDDYLEAEWDVV